MEQMVRVKETFPDGTATVLLVRESACSGDCHKCSGCGAAEETMVLTVSNPIGAAAGDMVRIEAPSAPVLAAAAVMYLVPLGLFFGGYLLGEVLWKRGGLLGCLAFGLGIAGAVCYDRLVVKKRKSEYTITRILKEA